MALRGTAATATACKFGGILNKPIPLPILHLPELGLHRLPSLHLQRFSSFQINQPGQNGFAPPLLSSAALKCRIRALTEAAVDSASSNKENEDQSPQSWKIKMLYDGDCPLCMREVDMLRERNKRYGTIKFVDISSDDYSSEENQGLDYKTVMGRIHAILADGTVVRDVEAFRRLYEQVGLGWIYAVTKYEPIATLANAIYGVWAKYRLQITGRPTLEEILVARKRNKAEVCDDSRACKM